MGRRVLFVVLIVDVLLLGVPYFQAQSSVLDLPRSSQRARVVQRIGISDITITYHRPLVNGRKVWGSLVPYGQVWRAGANENTTIEFSDPVAIEGKPLPRGVYGLHMIPGETWTIIFSRNTTSWGSFTYTAEEDALRVNVKPQPCEFHEALAYDFDNIKPDSTDVTLRWERLAVPFEVEVNVDKIVQQSLRNQLRGLAQYTWEGGDDAANYLVANKGNLEDALRYSNLSIRTEERFENLMTKSRILDTMARKNEAAAIRNKALAMGNARQLHAFGRQLQLEGKQDQAFEIFRTNMKKYPNDWEVHSEAARLACARRDFAGAVKEMKLAAAGAPDQSKPLMDNLVKRLEAKEDINK